MCKAELFIVSLVKSDLAKQATCNCTVRTLTATQGADAASLGKVPPTAVTAIHLFPSVFSLSPLFLLENKRQFFF